MAEHVERIGRRIRQRREDLGLTQTGLARAMPGSVDGPQISRWERGVHEPNPEHKEDLAKALKTTVAYFLMDPPKKGTTPTLAASDGSERLDRIKEQLDEVLEILKGDEDRDAEDDPPVEPPTPPAPEPSAPDEGEPRTPEEARRPRAE